MIDTTGWSAMKKLKHSLLRRAFDENRGGEVILLIQWRAAQVRHLAQKDQESLQKFEERNAGQPRAIRALNLIEERNGSGTIHRLTEEKRAPKNIFEQIAAVPADRQILYTDKILAAKIEKYKDAPALDADHYDPMEGLQVISGYDLACRDIERVGRPRYPTPVLKN